MKLYYTPHTCSLGIHTVLEEIGKPYEAQLVDLMKGEQYGDAYKAINPKSKVPVLKRDDGSILTELPAIAFYLAQTNPETNLLPKDAEGQAHALELMDYMVGSMHMRGFSRMFRPEAFSTTPLDNDTKEAVVEAGRQMVRQGFAILQPVLGQQDYLLGSFSIVDCVAFFLETWARGRAKIEMPANFEAHLDRMMARPAVQRAMVAGGVA